MKVQALINLGTLDYPDHPLMLGEVGDVSEILGRLMVARGHAVEIPAEPVTAKLVAEPAPVIQAPSTPEVPAVKAKPKAGK